MNKTFNKRGFTLIELLVVIAIIGILSSVVLASLNTARTKGADAAIKSNLSGIRSQANIVYDDEGNYDNVCTNATIVASIEAAKLASGIASTTTNTLLTGAGSEGGLGKATCHAATNTWAIEIPLKTDPNNFFCVNDNGIASVTTGSTLGDGETDCQ
jgi:prepilin-type N-terminal cleavage/methylation domain-containing protein